MPESALSVLLDQNIPVAATAWLLARRPAWTVRHVNELGFAGKSDAFLYRWAQRESSVFVTYDEDFADARCYPLGKHRGIIRLRVWPTTTEATISALSRLLNQLPDADWPNSLIIVDNRKIRVRRA
jgi:predicted nuclease of predicted toxin-antitoxin system